MTRFVMRNQNLFKNRIYQHKHFALTTKRQMVLFLDSTNKRLTGQRTNISVRDHKINQNWLKITVSVNKS